MHRIAPLALARLRRGRPASPSRPKTLPKGEVRAAAGLSGEAIASDYASALQNARNEAAGTNSQPNDAAYAKGALVAAAVNPGVAPFLSARVGVGHDFEGGLTYTGRAVRVDFRRSFSFGEDKAWAVSIGVGGTAALYGSLQGGSLPGVNLSDLKGWGADLPVLVGYTATDGLYMVWLGARGGWEHDTIQELTSEPKTVGLGVPPDRAERRSLLGGRGARRGDGVPARARRAGARRVVRDDQRIVRGNDGDGVGGGDRPGDGAVVGFLSRPSQRRSIPARAEPGAPRPATR